MLKSIIDRQKKFQTNFFDIDSLSNEDKLKWTKEFVLCLHQELSEVMNSIDWKSYHTYDKTYSVDNTKEELVDCFKFLLNLMILWNMDENELVKLFNTKSDIVEQRLKIK